MPSIKVQNVSLNYPIYGTDNRSFKQSLLKITTGGKFLDTKKTVVVRALEDINFTIHSGDRLGLVGHNGAGKTTLLKVLTGVYEPTGGQVSVTGNIAALLDISLGMDPDLTGYENIKVKGLMMNLNKKEIRQLIPDIVAFTEMGDFLHMPVKTYSSGMTLRLAFAITTAIVPEILLMDEAISAGDLGFIGKAEKRLNEFVEKSDILVLASHSNDIIRQFCNKAMWLEHGRVKAYGTVEEVVTQYEAAMAAQIATSATQQAATADPTQEKTPTPTTA